MLFVLVVWVILHLNVVHSLDFKRSGMDIWFQTNSLFPSFWYTMLHFRQSYPVTLCFACFTSWDFMFQLLSLDKYLSTFCYSMYKDKQLNQTLCHIILSYINFLQKRGKKHLFSTATKTVTQNYKPGHMISSKTFSTIFMGDESAKSIQACIVTYKRNLNWSIKIVSFVPGLYLFWEKDQGSLHKEVSSNLLQIQIDVAKKKKKIFSVFCFPIIYAYQALSNSTN